MGTEELDQDGLQTGIRTLPELDILEEGLDVVGGWVLLLLGLQLVHLLQGEYVDDAPLDRLVQLQHPLGRFQVIHND